MASHARSGKHRSIRIDGVNFASWGGSDEHNPLFVTLQTTSGGLYIGLPRFTPAQARELADHLNQAAQDAESIAVQEAQ